MQRLNLITGPNGSGKSSAYRALRLLAETAQGGFISSIAREGGLQSTLWAGPEAFSRSVKRGDYAVQGTVRTERISLKLGFSGEEFGYAVDVGLPTPSDSAFGHDPAIKRECIWSGALLRPASLLFDRRTSVLRTRGDDGEWNIVSHSL